MSLFSLSDDIVLKILFNLEADPRDLARLACACTKLSSLIRHICWKTKCSKTIPAVVADLVPPSSSSFSSSIDCPSGGWSALHKLSVCCPGLHHAGVLLENSDFGLERELGPDQNYQQMESPDSALVPCSTSQDPNLSSTPPPLSADCPWSLYDDLYLDFVYDVSETQTQPELPELQCLSGIGVAEINMGEDVSIQTKKRKKCESTQTHLASSIWKLSREEGNKLLARRFKGDCLYICDWPGCVHTEEKRNYTLFRGIFKDFKKSQVWRTINDGNRSKIRLDCAFCPCEETWDLHSAFCLRRVFGYHDNGEPVVRAYVCENGHVSGAWTERPMYA